MDPTIAIVIVVVVLVVALVVDVRRELVDRRRRRRALGRPPLEVVPGTPLRPRLWLCACGWRGPARELVPTPGGAASGLACPECGASGGLISREWEGSDA